MHQIMPEEKQKDIMHYAVLAKLVDVPQPQPALKALLSRLCQDPRNTVSIAMFTVSFAVIVQLDNIDTSISNCGCMTTSVQSIIVTLHKYIIIPQLVYVCKYSSVTAPTSCSAVLPTDTCCHCLHY
jgi:hypothetical protein